MILPFPGGGGGIVLGRDPMRGLDVSIGLSWGRRPDARPGELRWRGLVEIAFDWLPVLVATPGPAPRGLADEFDSARWTGRSGTSRLRWRRALLVLRPAT